MYISDKLQNYINKSHHPLETISTELPRSWSKSYLNVSKVSLPPLIDFKGNAIEKLSALLLLTYGITNWNIVNRNIDKYPYIKRLKRALPSGGALYPNEIYLYVQNHWGIEQGIYHYNSYFHELSLLRRGKFYRFIEDNIYKEVKVKSEDLIVFITNILDKNSHKYGNLSYRIQTLDTGVALQRFVDVTTGMGDETEIIYNFHDENMESLLGIDNHAGKIDQSLHKVYKLKIASTTSVEIGFKNNIFKLPKPQKLSKITPEEYLKKRYTTFHQFSGGTIKLQDLSNILASAYLEYKTIEILPIMTYLYCNQVEDIDKGIYLYKPSINGLRLIEKGDKTDEIYKYLIQPDLDLNRVSVSLFLVGDYSFATEAYFNRGYRILNMSAGLITQRFYHAAVLCDLAKYPFLSYYVDGIKKLLRLEENSYPLILFFLGNERKNHIRIEYPMYL